MTEQNLPTEQHKSPKANSWTPTEQFQIDWILSEAKKQKELQQLGTTDTCHNLQDIQLYSVNLHSDPHLPSVEIKTFCKVLDDDVIEITI